jgi:hypothetical protein
MERFVEGDGAVDVFREEEGRVLFAVVRQNEPSGMAWRRGGASDILCEVSGDLEDLGGEVLQYRSEVDWRDRRKREGNAKSALFRIRVRAERSVPGALALIPVCLPGHRLNCALTFLMENWGEEGENEVSMAVRSVFPP